MRKIVTILVAVLALSFTVSAETVTKATLNNHEWLVIDISDEVDVNYDILRNWLLPGYLKNTATQTGLTIESMVDFKVQIMLDVDARTYSGSKLNAEGKKFYNNQLLYFCTVEHPFIEGARIYHFIVATYTNLTGKTETAMTHVCFTNLEG